MNGRKEAGGGGGLPEYKKSKQPSLRSHCGKKRMKKKTGRYLRKEVLMAKMRNREASKTPDAHHLSGKLAEGGKLQKGGKNYKSFKKKGP